MRRGEPEVSVIIPAINEEKYIAHAIEGLRRQSSRDFEVIVVDGGSKDRTREIARRIAKVVISRAKGAGKARNFGARLAKGRILLFIDADTKPTSDLVKSYENAMKDKRVIAATGPIFPLEKVGWRFSAGYSFVSIFFVKLSLALRRPTFMGSNFAVRKSAFDNVHGFDEKLATYEDWDLSNRLTRQGKMVYVENATVYTSVRRVKKWGMSGYFAFYVDNFLRYHILKKVKTNYTPVR